MIDAILYELMHRYNSWYGEQFEAALARYDAETIDQSDSIVIDSQPWFDLAQTIYKPGSDVVLFSGKPLDYLGKSPSPSQVIEFAWAAAAICDEAIPMPIANLIKDDLSVINALVPVLLSANWNQIHADYEDQESVALARLIELCGTTLTIDQFEMVLNHFVALTDPDGLVTDALKKALASQRDHTLPLLTSRLQEALADGKAVVGPVESLMIFLGEAGSTSHSPETFDVMRTAFRRADNKQIAAICLGDFNDPRGITVLRSWLDSHPDADRATRMEITASIKRLGGE
ncbi:MAG: hypothetical protein PHC86_00555 [Eubacteriales bacterium]|nr:hypothetical protein [Eubacteriales bacterium]